eukprot:gnl/MRDRNA2_/MRDRNA2_64720_c0_seq1.p1 gnl/MRDRNA2_/MRDRNA2_64720_c0~~gnl/MRDRNA2_/MRDRNA2_64720_c0_seq1.p1  ORF type:complete len:290 (-),score=43.45 gnl/MRDRNA2_/MRDRNA2_64720_c0_seq1:47-916(-)
MAPQDNGSFAMTTRVLKPPGGGSSICLGGGDCSEPSRRESISRKGQVPLPQSYSEPRISIGWDLTSDASVPRRASNTVQNRAPKDDVAVAGVRTDRLHAMKTPAVDRLGKIKQKAGSQGIFTSDRNASDTMRYHREEGPAVGRQQKPSVLRPEATKAICESHRYFLAADGQADRLTGKAGVIRAPSEASGGYPGEPPPAGKPRTCTSLSGAEFHPQPSRNRSQASRRYDDHQSQSKLSKSDRSHAKKACGSSSSQTTTASQSKCSQSCYSAYSETDSIPFGADWSTFCA